jgi:hypothetical protein
VWVRPVWGCLGFVVSFFLSCCFVFAVLVATDHVPFQGGLAAVFALQPTRVCHSFSILFSCVFIIVASEPDQRLR